MIDVYIHPKNTLYRVKRDDNWYLVYKGRKRRGRFLNKANAVNYANVLFRNESRC